MKTLDELCGDRIAIIGGMGPLASAEFVRTIYTRSLQGRSEQSLPNLILLSDPTVPDRSMSFISGDAASVTRKINTLIDEARSLHATDALICCFTAHYILPLLDSANRDMVISLTDLALQLVLDDGGRYLLGATEGCLAMSVFQRSPLWKRARSQITVPSDNSREAIHSLIYHVKSYGFSEAVAAEMKHILHNSSCDGIICGCTELHLLSMSDKLSSGIRYIDPLLTIANALRDRESAIAV